MIVRPFQPVAAVALALDLAVEGRLHRHHGAGSHAGQPVAPEAVLVGRHRAVDEILRMRIAAHFHIVEEEVVAQRAHIGLQQPFATCPRVADLVAAHHVER